MAHVRDHLQKFRAFAVVVQLGSFRKAAVRLRVSQPALSQSVQILESVLGKRLLVRTSRGVVPTEEGKVVREFAERLAIDLDVLEQKIVSAREGDPMTGHVRLGCFESITISFLPGFIACVAERFPKLVVSITSGTASELPEMLLDRRIQLAIFDRPRDEHPIVTEDLFHDRYRFFVRSNSGNDKRLLTRLPLILVPNARDDAGHSMLDYVASSTGRRRPTIELSTFEAVKAFTLRGIGIGVVPSLVAKPDVDAQRLREIEIPNAPVGGFGEHCIVAGMHRRDRSDPRLARVLEELKRYGSVYLGLGHN
jgi:DNA-binding transcriptional LysR family regulator